MSLFAKILDKLGLGRNDTNTSGPSPSGSPAPAPAPANSTPAPTLTAPISDIDVSARLDSLAAGNPEKLNWKVSIVDLLKLLGLDSSLAARKELATELGCPAEKMGDSAQMNIWLHKTVLQKLAANGGSVPQELL